MGCENAQPLRVADTKSDERFNADVDTVTGYETRSVLCVPLLIKKEVIGVIELLNKKEGFYSEKDKELITYLSDQAAIFITQHGQGFMKIRETTRFTLQTSSLRQLTCSNPREAGAFKESSKI